MAATLSQIRRNILCGRCCYDCKHCKRNFLDDDPVFLCAVEGRKMEYSETLKNWCKEWKAFSE